MKCHVKVKEVTKMMVHVYNCKKQTCFKIGQLIHFHSSDVGLENAKSFFNHSTGYIIITII